jgi:putative tryptophan/tyrosine transport system substrate-binding protein
MRRRDFAAALGVAWLAWGRAPHLWAQGAAPVIGFLSGRSRAETVAVLDEFHRGLVGAGVFDARVEYRWADGNYARLPTLAAELVSLGVSVIVATGGNVTAIAAKEATAVIPIVFVSGGDPVNTGLVHRLNQPGGNVTGVSLAIAELAAKRLDLLRELAPKAKVIAVLLNPSNPTSMTEAREVVARAAALGLKAHMLSAVGETEFPRVFEEAAALQVQALLVANDPFLIDLRERLVPLITKSGVPALYFTRDFVHAGGLMSYGASIGDGYHKAGGYAGQILKGAKPASLPVLQPTKFEFALNLKAANALGLSIPLTLQAQADEVIE